MANPMTKPTDATPHGMLKLFRQEMDEFSLQQVKMFNGMSVSDRCELLFMMSMHNNKVLQYVHHLVEPDKAITVGMPEPEKLQ